ncbi:transglycosylase domain-containing protein [Luedemannella flava]
METAESPDSAENPEAADTPAAAATPEPAATDGSRRVDGGATAPHLRVLVAILGLAAAAGAVYVSSVPTPNAITLRESTVVYYSDGKTVMARLGQQNRTIIDTTKLPPYVAWAVMSAEDRTFETNPGVDFKGLVRGVVGSNDGPGASTITMQYARIAADITGATGPDVAVMAWKFDDEYSKQQIMDMYLNTVYFGRGAYGIEAAAYAYFAKSAKSLTLPEAMVLAGVIKSPGDGAFDPSVNLDTARTGGTSSAPASARPPQEAPGGRDGEAHVPTVFVKWSPETPATGSGLDEPTGLIVQQVLAELRQLPEFKGKEPGFIENGGFKIVTTIDAAAEDIALSLADETRRGSLLYGQPKTLQAAVVAIEPGTGRVLAYYGGHNGMGADFASWYYDAQGEPTGYGAHPPGSTAHVYGLATALRNGISLKSYWSADKIKTFPASGRDATRPVRNAPRRPASRPARCWRRRRPNSRSRSSASPNSSAPRT